MSDPYLDPETGVLRNRLGLKDPEALDLAERRAASLGLDRIDAGYGPERTFDRDHLKAIHRQIFGRVYEWAGSMRDERPLVDGERLDPVSTLSKGGSAFLHASRIDMGLSEAFKPIADRDALRAGSRDDFIEKAGGALGDLNYVHPFREGNGRTQRTFIEELGRETDHDVDFRGITRERMIAASIEVTEDPSSDAMRHVVRDAVDPERRDALIKARGMLDKAGLDPDEQYVVSARDGERIEGRLVWNGSKHAHIAAGQRIVIANAADLPRADGESKDVAFTAAPFSSDRDASRAEALDDHAETLHGKSLAAMRAGLSEIDDPAKLEAARKLIERMEEVGQQFREDRAGDDRPAVDPREDATQAASRANAERRQTAADQAVRSTTDRNADHTGRDAEDDLDR